MYIAYIPVTHLVTMHLSRIPNVPVTCGGSGAKAEPSFANQCCTPAREIKPDGASFSGSSLESCSSCSSNFQQDDAADLQQCRHSQQHPLKDGMHICLGGYGGASRGGAGQRLSEQPQTPNPDSPLAATQIGYASFVVPYAISWHQHTSFSMHDALVRCDTHLGTHECLVGCRLG